MRNALVQFPGYRSKDDERKVLRAAIRQLERADVYLGAVEAMELNDADAGRAVRRLLADVGSLRRYLSELRARS
jgi:nucleoside 2-deoxyribosyltransferase